MNSRIATAKKAFSFGIAFLFWVPIIFFSLLLVYNTLPYFTFDPDMPFIEERSVLYDKWVWKWSFYVHIAAGCICILTAITQFSSWILKKRKKIHVWAGKAYVFVVLLIGAPSGFYMTFFAKGGFWERSCFMGMAIFWFYTTYKGFVSAARDKNYLSHKFWMMRSYAMALTAVTFRVYHVIFFMAGWNHFDNYAVSLWISVLGNAAVAELIIFFKNRNYLRTLIV
jgi:hypothetical protein